MRWLNVQEIYADGRHNAWPDICRWRGLYYVAFNCGGRGHGGVKRIAPVEKDASPRLRRQGMRRGDYAAAGSDAWPPSKHTRPTPCDPSTFA